MMHSSTWILSIITVTLLASNMEAAPQNFHKPSLAGIKFDHPWISVPQQGRDWRQVGVGAPHPGIAHPGIDNRRTNIRDDRIRLLKSIMSDQPCPEPYKMIWGQCLYISKNLRYNLEMSKKFCRDIGGDLARLRHPQVLRIMLSDGYAPDFIAEGSSTERYLVGATFNASESSFQWDSYFGRELIPDEDVEKGDNSPKRACLYLDTNPSFEYTFGYQLCERKSAFVCEFDNYYHIVGEFDWDAGDDWNTGAYPKFP